MEVYDIWKFKSANLIQSPVNKCSFLFIDVVPECFFWPWGGMSSRTYCLNRSQHVTATFFWANFKVTEAWNHSEWWWMYRGIIPSDFRFPWNMIIFIIFQWFTIYIYNYIHPHSVGVGEKENAVVKLPVSRSVGHGGFSRRRSEPRLKRGLGAPADPLVGSRWGGFPSSWGSLVTMDGGLIVVL